MQGLIPDLGPSKWESRNWKKIICFGIKTNGVEFVFSTAGL